MGQLGFNSNWLAPARGWRLTVLLLLSSVYRNALYCCCRAAEDEAGAESVRFILTEHKMG
jgi:hypothetical protein